MTLANWWRAINLTNYTTQIEKWNHILNNEIDLTKNYQIHSQKTLLRLTHEKKRQLIAAM